LRWCPATARSNLGIQSLLGQVSAGGIDVSFGEGNWDAGKLNDAAGDALSKRNQQDHRDGVKCLGRKFTSPCLYNPIVKRERDRRS